MSANPIHNLVLHYVQRQVEDATARRDAYTKQLVDVKGEFNDQGDETLSAEDSRASIESNLGDIERYLSKAEQYQILPPGDLSTTPCPHCFLRYEVHATSLNYVNDIDGEIHCVECKTIIE